jgi:ATP-dependent helicase/nuclease subunit A
MSKIPLKPQNETFTDTQWQAIFDKGDNILVSASAGSGKTTVLVRRVIEKLKAGSNIDELLIVTFTEAAAREMKERIQVALQTAINQESQSEKRQHFSRQLQLLPTANISTLHAFCLTVIRRYYYLIDLDPNFRMLTDETEILLLKEEIWTQLRDAHYEANDEAFFRLTENFASDRSDESVGDLILSLYDFARANPDPVKWLDNLAVNYEGNGELGENHLYQTQVKPALVEIATTAEHLLQSAKQFAEQSPLMEKAAILVQDEINQAQEILGVLATDDLSLLYDRLTHLTFGRYPSYRKEEQKELSQEIKPLRDEAKKLMEQIKNYFPYPPEEMQRMLQLSGPIVTTMAEMTKEFLLAFQTRKLAKGLLDFNDLEHFTLKILRGEGTGSEAAVYYRDKFEEVLVDEYQDVNRLQEAILYWVRQVAGDHGNMFMVGDVKQSIYSFRLADPTLFIEKYLAFENQDGGRRIVLAENFRSRKEVLEFTNLIFQQLMDEKVGQIPYDDAATLIPGFPNFPESDAFKPELLIYEKEAGTTGSIDDKTEGELHVTAIKIQELVQSKFLIYDKQSRQERPVTYKDIVLLTPTRKNNLVILDVFKKFGIPLEVNDAQNYFQATEIQVMIALLQIIDNPYQDIPLVSVLRSPIVGLTEDELAEIRLADRNSEFYQAVLTFQENQTDESPLNSRLTGFLKELNRWREAARRLPIPDLLWDIYDTTAYLTYVVGLPAGQQRYANLIALIHRAEKYEKSSFRGLYQFIRFIEKMQEKDKDLAEPLATPAENAVRVMTVHASKGLEFPVVFLLDTTKFFNYQDFQKRFIFEEQLGAGIQYIEATENIKYETIPFQAIKQVRLKKALSEEMRKLYVALTRAEQKLYLVGSYKDQAAAFKSWQAGLTQSQQVLDPALRLVARGSLLDWVGLTLIRHPDMEVVFPDASERKRTIHHPANFQIHWWTQEQIDQYSQVHANEQVIESQEPVAATSETLQARLDYQYPYHRATQTTSYQSVSELKRLYNDPDDQEITLLEWHSAEEKLAPQRFRYVETELAKPRFLQEEKPQGAAIGSATHTVMQMLPLTEIPTEDFLETFIDELVLKQFFTEEVAAQINRSSIQWFYQTDLGQTLLKHGNLVKREQPFSMLKEAATIFQGFDEPDAELLIHGIIDGYIELPDRILLYDFKTDAVFGSEAQIEKKMRDRYYGQLRLYCQALEQALNKPVTETYLVLLSAKKIIQW